MSAFDAIAVGRRVLNVEAEALRTLSQSLDNAFVQAVETLFNAKGRIVCTGMGTWRAKSPRPWPRPAPRRCSCIRPRPATATLA